ncbi:unnamed protein product [Didymodactylos carnosus]|uniref:Nbr1 FW domain-containing protein n=1 Tax=Didymodactylos carnosus TaxID=1234261 RepID=A0A814T4U7_9BILA|nr:unnamed protein product [Didymodactylos carnosus]CAF1194055.1 unnamed protein product [Didymodactylos carnosus]CAF3920156.1 unnamed protein product [Didymodactylos carnosus]CAF4004334.1 unnamed protein product [Didymodactylos carnosus]
MDVDSESTAAPTPGGTSVLDAKFLESFRSFTTDDREHLINQFRALTNAQLTNEGIGFFLDMNNWNLNAAIVAYYDFEQPSDKFPMMKFVADVTVGEGEAVPPSTRFTKTWRIENSGSEPWPSSCVLKFVNGDRLQERDETYVGLLAPNQQTNVSIDMTSPVIPGIYKSQWRLFTPAGVPFGDPIWLIASVEEGGLLGITQQLSALGGNSINDNDDNMMTGQQSNLSYNPVIIIFDISQIKIMIASAGHDEHFNDGNDEKSTEPSSYDKFIGIPSLLKQHRTQLDQFNQWFSKRDWLSFHHHHYDWWAFPVNERSSRGCMYQLTDDNITELQTNEKFISDLRQCAKLVCLSWGWDIDEKELCQITDEHQKWAYWPVRLYKIGRCMFIFDQEDYYQSLKQYAIFIQNNKKEKLDFFSHTKNRKVDVLQQWEEMEKTSKKNY